MIPVETLAQKLSEWSATGAGPHSADFSFGAWGLHLSATTVDTMGARLTAIELTRSPTVADDPIALEKHARAVAARVTGLMEPLCFLEIDRTSNVALLRSGNPPIKGDQVLYYEARLNGMNHTTLHRYKANRHSPAGRESVPFVLTHEAIAKLADDLAG